MKKCLLGYQVIAQQEVFMSHYSKSKGNIKCRSLNNQLCKARPTLYNINSDEFFFIHLLLVLISLEGAVAILTIPMLEFVFQK